MIYEIEQVADSNVRRSLTSGAHDAGGKGFYLPLIDKGKTFGFRLLIGFSYSICMPSEPWGLL